MSVEANSHENEIDLSSKGGAIIKRACFDCHSNQTAYPWYSKFYPLNKLISHDVKRGREELNFSSWKSYPVRTQIRKLQWIGRSTSEGTMPPLSYRLLHWNAGISSEEKRFIGDWTIYELRRLGSQND